MKLNYFFSWAIFVCFLLSSCSSAPVTTTLPPTEWWPEYGVNVMTLSYGQRDNLIDRSNFCEVMHLVEGPIKFSQLDAKDFCSSVGMRLGRIKSRAGHKFLSQIVVKFDFWIDLERDAKCSAGFAWSDGECLDHGESRWARGQPKIDVEAESEDCVSYNAADKAWTVTDCYQPMGFLCQYEECEL